VLFASRAALEGLFTAIVNFLFEITQSVDCGNPASKKIALTTGFRISSWRQ
jgi:hypothetical protein